MDNVMDSANNHRVSTIVGITLVVFQLLQQSYQSTKTRLITHGLKSMCN